MEELYNAMSMASSTLQRNIDGSLLAALTEVAEDLHAGDIHQEDGLPDAETTARLRELLQPIKLDGYQPEEIRQAMQLVLVKVMQFDAIEPNKQVTPDALATLATFLINLMLPTKPQELAVADVAVGTGNLLFAVMNALAQQTKAQVHGYGVDNDEDLLALAGISATLQDLRVDLYHQDALDTLVFGQTDIVVSDLPVGYYPLDDRARGFGLAAKSGHSYAHHLLIEQGLRQLKPGGLGLFYVPANVFKTAESATLTQWLTKHAFFQGLITLPQAMFGSADAQKSLLFLQKPGAGARQATQVLLGEFPSLDDVDGMKQFVNAVQAWYQANIQLGD
ncbi:adenine-specific DNA methylase [Lacticaseibacillus thailandensis DSM 22698 = JCM 13996]|uniref:Adenine-specific DNA methylase n=2 Tax=Lacticaseibacillus thailandensis TaxID=381741 RepID=A0A0R2C960_9LACO|nr:adenine-specific DNA methylase [Lacticaseibacillus thailandensis DSM 22698 = JCM 13996]